MLFFSKTPVNYQLKLSNSPVATNQIVYPQPDQQQFLDYSKVPSHCEDAEPYCRAFTLPRTELLIFINKNTGREARAIRNPLKWGVLQHFSENLMQNPIIAEKMILLYNSAYIIPNDTNICICRLAYCCSDRKECYYCKNICAFLNDQNAIANWMYCNTEYVEPVYSEIEHGVTVNGLYASKKVGDCQFTKVPIQDRIGNVTDSVSMQRPVQIPVYEQTQARLIGGLERFAIENSDQRSSKPCKYGNDCKHHQKGRCIFYHE